jgi:hypothetical protein
MIQRKNRDNLPTGGAWELHLLSDMLTDRAVFAKAKIGNSRKGMPQNPVDLPNLYNPEGLARLLACVGDLARDYCGFSAKGRGTP